MPGSIQTYPVMRFFTNAGAVLASGKIYTYAAGTTTPKTAYKDAALTVAHTNPIVLDVNGSVAFAIFGSGSYKIDVQDSASVSIAGYPIDSITWGNMDSSFAQALLGTLTMTGAAINEAKGADIPSAATTDIGAATGNYVKVTGATTITSLGTIQAGTYRVVEFGGILTLTHNATSLILPAGQNIKTYAGYVGHFVSMGAGNWSMVAETVYANGTIAASPSSNAKSVTTAINITNFGANAGAKITTGNSNSNFGTNAGAEITTGADNSNFGYIAGAAITSGYSNTNFGSVVGAAITSGYRNSNFGTSAGATITSGNDNSNFGVSAGAGIVLGLRNSNFGVNAGASGGSDNNSNFGYNAGTAMTTGSSNSNFGSFSGAAITSGYRNANFGYSAGTAITTGLANCNFGYYAGKSITTGIDNCNFGSEAGQGITTGDENSNFGRRAGLSISGGLKNANFGLDAGAGITFGAENSNFGPGAGRLTTTGGGNSTFGSLAGDSITTGLSNSCFGVSSDVFPGSLINATALGAEAVATASHMVRIGNGSVTVIQGQVAYTFPSDERIKVGIANLPLGLEFVNTLRPVEFKMVGGNEKTDYGFIAQEVEASLFAFGYDDTNMINPPKNDKDLYTYRSADMIAVLAKAVQELSTEVDRLKALIV